MAENLLEAVADPLRLRLLRVLARNGSMSVGELAGAVGIHANTARAHLAALARGGVVERSGEPAGRRGRPSVRYRLRPGWQLPTTDLGGLAELLADLALRETTAEQREAGGARWGRYLAGRPGTDAERRLGHALERLGFDHQRSGSELRLTGCPCPLVAPERPDRVCRLIESVIAGMLEMRDRPLRIGSSLHDPARRSCTLTLSPAAGSG